MPKKKTRTKTKSSLSKSEIAKYSNLAKKANQRLRQLEKSQLNTPAYKWVLRQGQKGINYIGKTSKGQVKFRTDITKLSQNKSQFNAYIKALDSFLNAKTSSITQVKAMLNESRKTFNDRFNMNLSQQEYLDMWSSSAIQSAMGLYGSTQVLDIIKKAPDNMSLSEIEKVLVNRMGEPIYNIKDDIGINNNDLLENEPLPFT